MLRPMSYPEIYMPDEEDYHPIAVGKTRFTRPRRRGRAATILDRVGVVDGDDGRRAVPSARRRDGARAGRRDGVRPPREQVHGDDRGVYEQVEDTPTHQAWVEELAGALGLDGRGAYVNFLGEEGEAGVRAAYPDPTWDRLRQSSAGTTRTTSSA